MGRQPSLHILLIEDDVDDAVIFSRHAGASTRYRFQVAHAVSDGEARRRLSEGKYEIIFLDYRLGGGVTGLEILQKLRADGVEIPIIVLTGAGDEETAVEIMKAGATDYRLKDTFNTEVLDRSVRYALEQERHIIERKRAEEALKRAAGQWQETFDGISDIIGLIDRNNHILRVNRAFCETFGGEAEEFVGRYCFELFHGTRRPPEWCPCTVAFESGAPAEHEFQEKHLGNRSFRAACFPIRDADGEVVQVVHVVSDITDRKQAEQERLEIERRALEAQRLESVGMLAGGIAHDFNNILTGVIGPATLVMEKLEEGNPARKDLELVVNSAERLAELTQQMLAYARGGRYQPIALDLNTVVGESSIALQAILGENVELQTELAEKLSLISADKQQMQQVMLNLCKNAGEAMQPDGGLLTIRTRNAEMGEDDLREAGEDLEVPKPGRYVALEVQDSGCGMDEATQAKIFEPFFSTKFVGRGLGLAAVHGIVKNHGGFVQVQSSPGEGATLTVFLPAVDE